jgi:hypothetical protein
MIEPLPCVVLVEHADDIESLRNMAYAAAHQVHDGATEHWDEDWLFGAAFHFMTFRAAFAFMAWCGRSGIRYSVGGAGGLVC